MTPHPEYVKGGWSPLERGEIATCAFCRKEKAGIPGARGGKAWMWQLPTGERCCSKECGKATTNALGTREMDAEMKFEQRFAEGQ